MYPFQTKLNILRREFGHGLLCYPLLCFLSLYVGMRTKPENFLYVNTSVNAS